MRDLIIIFEYISQMMLKQGCRQEMRHSREGKPQKTSAIGWLKQCDNDARTILQTIYFPHVISNPKESVSDDFKTRCPYDRGT